jgi:Domain of unknown function (DUF4173)
MTDLALDPPPGSPAGPATAVRAAADPVARRLVALALVTGLALDIGLRGGVTNAVVVAGLVLLVVTLVTERRVERREARVLALAALVPVALMAVRTSPWLALSNLAVAAGLLGASVVYSRSGSVLDTTPGRALLRGLEAFGNGILGLSVVGAVMPPLSSPTRDRAGRVGMALLVTVPVAGLLVALLASADAVFASLLTPDVDAGPATGHVVFTVVLALGVLVVAGAAAKPVDDLPLRGRFGVLEIATMLGLVAVVLGLFVVAQLVALTDAGDRLVEQAGLTPAEYARGGFFQLCWAAGLLLAFLGLVRALASPEALARPLVRVLGALVPGLAIGLVVVSLRRMALYDEAFGLTMLRLWVVGAAVWMGLVLVMTAVRALGAPEGRNWVLAAAGGAALLLVLVAGVGNPEAFVVRHNLGRAADEASLTAAGAELDTEYLAGLSDDAVPAIADEIGATVDGATDRALLVALRCGDDPDGVAALNLAAARATDARERHCPS